MSLLRRTALLLFCIAVLYGFWWESSASDARWLLLLLGGWLLLVVALWPRLPAGTPTVNRTVLRTATLLASVFAVLSVQLVRLQVVQGRATVRRVATDPASDEVIANPRLQLDDLTIHRGSVFDRHGALLAGTTVSGDIARRHYPDPESGYLVGYFSPLLYGKTGLEQRYDAELTGRNGTNAVLRGLDDLLGRPQRGLDLHLTLDAELQRVAHRLLDGRTGGAVLLKVSTGEVLAMASYPTFDPNQLFTSSPGERDAAAQYWATLLADPALPLVSRATSGRYTPGSTFKVVTAAAAIDAGFADPDDLYTDNGQLDVGGHIINEYNRPDDSRESWSLREGLAWSLNVVLAQIGLELGPDVMADYARRFGFDDAPPFDLPTVQSQLASTPDFLDSLPGLADTAFGQGQLLATPLEMALIAAGIANGGSIMTPHLLATMTDAAGRPIRTTDPTRWKQPVSASTARTMVDLMVNNVMNGVAQAATIDGMVVGGKTGTAEVPDGDPHAWFIGFAGQQRPVYAVSVVLEHGGTGLSSSLGVGRDLLATAVQRGS